jgi:hypothetical protein
MLENATEEDLIWRWPDEPDVEYYYPSKRDWFDTEESIGNAYCRHKKRLIEQRKPRVDSMTDESEANRRAGKRDILLSYNSKDKAQVKTIEQLLMNNGITPWRDEWDIKSAMIDSFCILPLIEQKMQIPMQTLCFSECPLSPPMVSRRER